MQERHISTRQLMALQMPSWTTMLQILPWPIDSLRGLGNHAGASRLKGRRDLNLLVLNSSRTVMRRGPAAALSSLHAHNILTVAFLTSNIDILYLYNSIYIAVCSSRKKFDTKWSREHMKCELAVADSEHEGLWDLPNVVGAKNIRARY